eukprot:13577159-Alexandrium_andersonii.AAC.1
MCMCFRGAQGCSAVYVQREKAGGWSYVSGREGKPVRGFPVCSKAAARNCHDAFAAIAAPIALITVAPAGFVPNARARCDGA